LFLIKNIGESTADSPALSFLKSYIKSVRSTHYLLAPVHFTKANT